MPVTLKEVAERAGVSRSAVSRTFTEGACRGQDAREGGTGGGRAWVSSQCIGLVPDDGADKAYRPCVQQLSQPTVPRGL